MSVTLGTKMAGAVVESSRWIVFVQSNDTINVPGSWFDILTALSIASNREAGLANSSTSLRPRLVTCSRPVRLLSISKSVVTKLDKFNKY